MEEFKFDETRPTPLCTIMGKNRSDKGHVDITTSHHNYTTFYYHIFKEWRQKSLNIFEMGIGSINPSIPSNVVGFKYGGRPGASLFGWAEFFPNAKIYGADIDIDCIFSNTPRISTFFCDQTNKETIWKMWKNNIELDNKQFDIIIDDGLHEVLANVCFFENSIHKLAPGGYFIIEDIDNNNITAFQNIIETDWCHKYRNCTFQILKIPSLVNHSDNNLLVCHYIHFSTEIVPCNFSA